MRRAAHWPSVRITYGLLRIYMYLNIYICVCIYIFLFSSCTSLTRTKTGGKCNGLQRLIDIKERSSGVQKGVFFTIFPSSRVSWNVPNTRTLFNETTVSLADSLSLSPLFYMCVSSFIYYIFCVFRFFFSQFECHPARVLIYVSHVRLSFGMLFVYSSRRKLFYCCFISSENCFTTFFFLKDASFSRRRIFSRVGIVFFLFFLCAFCFKNGSSLRKNFKARNYSIHFRK